MDDIRAVMDDAGSERAVLFGWEDGGCQSLLYAASYPERTLALILFGIWVKYSKSPDYPWGWTQERTEFFWESLLADKWGTEDFWRTDSSRVSSRWSPTPSESRHGHAIRASRRAQDRRSNAETSKRMFARYCLRSGPDTGHAPAGRHVRVGRASALHRPENRRSRSCRAAGHRTRPLHGRLGDGSKIGCELSSVRFVMKRPSSIGYSPRFFSRISSAPPNRRLLSVIEVGATSSNRTTRRSVASWRVTEATRSTRLAKGSSPPSTAPPVACDALMRSSVQLASSWHQVVTGASCFGRCCPPESGNGRTTRSDVDKLVERFVATLALSRSVRGMGDGWTFAVTLVRPGPAVPSFEVGAYRYTGTSLPYVGDIVTITKATTTDTEERNELLAYVTRVDPTSDTPIRVTEATGVTFTSPR
jgi:hypothetical protein